MASKALTIKPNSFEAFYTRARAKRDDQQLNTALDDLTEAVRLAPENRELCRLLSRVQEECQEMTKLANSEGTTIGHERLLGQKERPSVLDIPDIVPAIESQEKPTDNPREETAL